MNIDTRLRDIDSEHAENDAIVRVIKAGTFGCIPKHGTVFFQIAGRMNRHPVKQSDFRKRLNNLVWLSVTVATLVIVGAVSLNLGLRIATKTGRALMGEVRR